MEILAEVILGLFGVAEPFKDPERDFGYLFLFGMALLLAVGVGAIVWVLRH